LPAHPNGQSPGIIEESFLTGIFIILVFLGSFPGLVSIYRSENAPLRIFPLPREELEPFSHAVLTIIPIGTILA
jgi:hypothetical protein